MFVYVCISLPGCSGVWWRAGGFGRAPTPPKRLKRPCAERRPPQPECYRCKHAREKREQKRRERRERREEREREGHDVREIEEHVECAGAKEGGVRRAREQEGACRVEGAGWGLRSLQLQRPIGFWLELFGRMRAGWLAGSCVSGALLGAAPGVSRVS